MIYLYVTPSGSVNLIEGDKIPIGERKTCGGKGFCCDYNTPCQSLEYEKHLQAAKASSVPVDDQERAVKIVQESIMGTGKGENSINPYGLVLPTDRVYGPFDIGYKKGLKCKQEGKPTCTSSANCTCSVADGLAEVAILLPEPTPSKSGELKLTPEQVKEREEAINCYRTPSLPKSIWEQAIEKATPEQRAKIDNIFAEILKSEPVGKIEEKEEPGVSKLKIALQDKIKEFEAFKTNPNYQTEMEQNAVIITLRELKYLDSIVEYE